MIAPKVTNKQKNGCKVWAFTDCTGMYDEILNPTGYGTPNDSPSDITEYTISIITPGSPTVYTFDVLATVNSIVLPSAYVENFHFTLISLEATDLGTSEIADGIYTVTYTVNGESQTYKTLLTCNAKCCVDKVLTKAMDTYLCGGNCKTNEMIFEALRARALLLQAVHWQSSCFDLVHAEQLLKQAQKICKTHKCGCGCS